MPDAIRKHFGYGQLRPLQPECSQNWPRWYKPDPTCRIWFSSVFLKKAWIILHKTDLDPVWMVWSGFDQTHVVWKQAGVQESSGPVPGSGRMQPARYQETYLQTRFWHSTDIPDNICAKPPQSCFSSGWLCQGLARQIHFRNKPNEQESYGPLLASASQPIQTRCKSDQPCFYWNRTSFKLCCMKHYCS